MGWELTPIQKVSRRGAYVVQKKLIQKEVPVIFDVGAARGGMTLAYRELFPEGYIYAFEPFAESFQTLTVATQGDGRIRIYNLAVSDYVGRGEFHANANPLTNSLLDTDERASALWGAPVYATRTKVPVDVVTLDSFVGENSIAEIDILKLDVQGAELSVLRGARELLSRQAIGLIYLEILVSPAYVNQPALRDYLDLFGDYGYALFDFYEPARRRGKLLQVDATFISKALDEEYAAALVKGEA